MKNFQLEFKFKDDHVTRIGTARICHSCSSEALALLNLAGETVEGYIEPVRFDEEESVGVNPNYPKHSVQIQTGGPGGSICSRQVPIHMLVKEYNPSFGD